MFRRLPSVKTQVLRVEGLLAGKLLTSTPRLVQSTGFPAFAPFEAGFGLKLYTRRTTETSDCARDYEAGGSALLAVRVEVAKVVEGKTS